jgi:hypothetical protein
MSRPARSRGAMTLVLLVGAVAVLSGHLALAQPRTLRILFIGNSLTSVNDLPALVRGIGGADGRKIITKAIAVNDSSLEDHWNRGGAAREIRRGPWDFVVLQQGPSSRDDSRILLREYVGRFAAVAAEAGARPALYMVWPSAARRRDFDRVSESYRLAAADVGGVLLPAGDAWRAAWARDPKAPLYGADGFHPSTSGSWLAGLVIYCRLADRPPASITKFPKAFPKRGQLLVDAATEALSR